MALGPAVHGAAYQVETSVADQVVASLARTGEPMAEARARFRALGGLGEDLQAGCERLDIRLAAAVQLQEVGVAPDRISICPLCTHGEPELFHSWRRDRVKAVQWSGLVSQA